MSRKPAGAAVQSVPLTIDRTAVKSAARPAARRPHLRLEATHESIVLPGPVVTVRQAVGGLLRRGLTLMAVVCVVGVVILSLHAIRMSPIPDQEPRIEMTGDPVSRDLLEAWIRAFPSYARLSTPDTDTIAAFAAFLREEPSVAAVNGVRLTYDSQTLERVLAVDLRLRQPLLPVRLADGHHCWISDDGNLLHPSITGAEDLPVLYGIEAGGKENLQEVLRAWPAMAAELPVGFITSIRCNAPQPGGHTFGIKFLTRSGTIIDWGAAGSASYGLDLDRKVANLIHTIRCQGDMRHVSRIDVRFPKPFAVLR